MKYGILGVLAAAVLLTGCGPVSQTGTNTENDKISDKEGEVPEVSGEIFAMDTYMTIRCCGERCREALDASLQEIKRLDEMLSVGNPDSEISLVNAAGEGMLSPDTGYMISRSLEIYETTEGAFDISIYPLMELWGFTSGDFRVPDQEELDATLALVGSDRIRYQDESGEIHLDAGQGIDLGGIAKGFTSGRLMEIFQEYDLVSGLVSLGGNVQCYGTKPDGSLWKCGITNPHKEEGAEDYLGILEVEDQAVITSGAYERYFTDEESGRTYHHILDPKTGSSAESGLISVTIVSEDGTLADALSTSCYIMGADKAIDYWKTYGDDFQMILMDKEDQVMITQGIEDRFETDYPMEVLTR